MSQFIKSTYEYSKLRKQFGRQPLFQMVPAHIVDSICSNKAQQKEYALRNPVNCDVQATLPQSEHECNTKQVIMKEQGINHEQGGWPREVHLDNEEQVHRHRRRVVHDDSYVQAVTKLVPTVKHCLNQNNAVELYNTYFTNMPLQLPVEKYSIKLSNIFRDSNQRPISSLVWTNEKNPKLAVSYYKSLNDLNEQDCNIWDLHQESLPLHYLEVENACWRLACSPVNPEIFLAGLENGVVNVFDIRKGREVVSSTSTYNSHRRPITGLLYIYSRNHTEFFTGAPDGMCLWWDMRNLSKPTDQLPMSVKFGPKEIPSIGNAEGVSSIQYDRGLPTRFLCGTESGLVINVNRMGKTHSEILASYYETQCGPVRAVHRSPCTTRMFITCGDWSVRIWSEEVRTAPIIVTRPYRHQVTDVAWAPLRFSSYMSVCEGGIFYYWDLLRKYKDPVVTLQISEYPLTKIAPHTEGEIIVVSDDHGSAFLLQLSENMTIPDSRDKVLMSQLYERETKREHILDNRVKEIHLKMRVKVETDVESDIIEEENLEKQAEDTYFEIVNKNLESMVRHDEEQ